MIKNKLTSNELDKILWLLDDYLEELEFANDHAGREVVKDLIEKMEAEKIKLEPTKSENDELGNALNEVRLIGWVVNTAIEKELSSGEVIAHFRIAVTRPEGGVDTIDLETLSLDTKNQALTLRDGEWVEINGSIRRRFWKSSRGLASSWAVITKKIERI